jgi:hypothetical protein
MGPGLGFELDEEWIAAHRVATLQWGVRCSGLSCHLDRVVPTYGSRARGSRVPVAQDDVLALYARGQAAPLE